MSKNVFSSAFDAMIKARTRHAEAYVNGMLLSLDDKELEARGYKRSELKKKPALRHPLW